MSARPMIRCHASAGQQPPLPGLYLGGAAVFRTAVRRLSLFFFPCFLPVGVRVQTAAGSRRWRHRWLAASGGSGLWTRRGSRGTPMLPAVHHGRPGPPLPAGSESNAHLQDAATPTSSVADRPSAVVPTP